ncbi:hypothetical protein RGR602_PC00554 (plasmid) [Rhizobium gallicum bv. gallicum R602sp]|uniref:Uncharacterized protein n=2 Tax=Rhizobium TaxID=379 RepID=A0A0B4X9B4_9HYPH|nr:hypothetical protein RGR602_PC00554 [Rhizobium gallicum bv. gallicum R602sp]
MPLLDVPQSSLSLRHGGGSVAESGDSSARRGDMTKSALLTRTRREMVPDLNRHSLQHFDVHQIWTHADYGVATASQREFAKPIAQSV